MIKRFPLALATAALFAGATFGQNLPDVAVSRVVSNNDWNYYGNISGISAYSFATTSCNVGNVVINWQPPLNMPVISQNVYRIVDGHIEQLGYSFLKDSFCAVSEPSCGSCQGTPCSTLGIGCADTYGAGLNDGANGWAKWPINANRGTWSATNPGPCCDAPTIRGRLQLETSALGDPNSVYVAESQYVSGHDQQAGLGQNNQSWIYTSFNNLTNPSNVGSTQMFEPGIMAWQDVHSDVKIEEANVIDEGGAGVHGFMWVGSKVTDLGGGLWRYDYAVQNQTSMQNVGRLSVPAGCIAPSTTQFRSVRHHSGSPYSNAPWNLSLGGSSITWQTEDFTANPNANAVRWGNLFSFSFVAGAAPDPNGVVELGLHTSGGTLSVPAFVPTPTAGGGSPFMNYCTATNNSTGAPAQLIPSGSPVATANDMEFIVTTLPLGNFGYFLMSQTQGFVQMIPGSAGNLCLGGNIVRFSNDVLNSGPFGFVMFAPDANNLPENTTWLPGETWNFQYWTRDGQGPSNFSDAATITFCQ